MMQIFNDPSRDKRIEKKATQIPDSDSTSSSEKKKHAESAKTTHHTFERFQIITNV